MAGRKQGQRQRRMRRALLGLCAVVALMLLVHWYLLGQSRARTTLSEDVFRQARRLSPSREFVWRQDAAAADSGSHATASIHQTATITSTDNDQLFRHFESPLQLHRGHAPLWNRSASLETKLRRMFKYEHHSQEFKYYEGRCGLQKNAPLLNFPSFHYMLNEPNKCAGQVFIIFVVHSAAGYRLRRDLIRNTWGSVRQVSSVVQRRRLCHHFWHNRMSSLSKL